MDDDCTEWLCAAHHTILRGHAQVPVCKWQKVNCNDTQFTTTQQAVCCLVALPELPKVQKGPSQP
jgi:hypothetical protein